MIPSGLNKIQPDTRDYSLLHTLGAGAPDPKGLPAKFSIYDGRKVPNQLLADPRFTPPLKPLTMGCTAESGAFESGIQDNALYNPKELYDNTPPYDSGGRDIRKMLKRLVDVGPLDKDGKRGPQRTAYFNCYGAFSIDDFDAARIALWVNQPEKRGVIVATFWYWDLWPTTTLPTPSYKLKDGSLHCYVITGWDTNLETGEEYLEIIPWLGDEVGNKGLFLLSRTIYNALLRQPWTGAFTITKVKGLGERPIGYQAVIDHLVYYITHLFL